MVPAVGSVWRNQIGCTCWLARPHYHISHGAALASEGISSPSSSPFYPSATYKKNIYMGQRWLKRQRWSISAWVWSSTRRKTPLDRKKRSFTPPTPASPTISPDVNPVTVKAQVCPDPTGAPTATPKKASLWNQTLKEQRAKHGLKGIPKRGTPEHVRVSKAYERALKKEAREKKKAMKK